MANQTNPFASNQRIEIPVHYDMWMRGARFGTVVGFRRGTPGKSAHILVRLDNPAVKKCLKVWALDFEYCKVI